MPTLTTIIVPLNQIVTVRLAPPTFFNFNDCTLEAWFRKSKNLLLQDFCRISHKGHCHLFCDISYDFYMIIMMLLMGQCSFFGDFNTISNRRQSIIFHIQKANSRPIKTW